MSLKKKILAFLSSEEPQVVKLAEEKLADGTVIVADNFEAGTPVFIKSQEEDGENVALPVGEYQLEDGRILKVEVEGEIASLEDAKIEAEEEEKMMDHDEDKMEEVVYDEAHMEAMHKAIADLTARIEALEGGHDMEEEEEYSEEEVKMSSEEEVQEEPKQEEEVKEEVKEEEAPEVEAAPVVEEVEEAAPIAHSPEAKDEKRVRFYFPKN